MELDPRRVQAVFLAAAECRDSADRIAVLERECSGDAELRGRVEALLRAHDQPDGPIDHPLAVAPDGAAISPDVGALRLPRPNPENERGDNSPWGSHPQARSALDDDE